MTSKIKNVSETPSDTKNLENKDSIRILPIRLRIAVGFLIILLAMGFMTYIFVSESQKVEHHLGNINNVNSVKQRYAINFRGSVHDRAISLRDVVLAEDLREVQIYLDEIDYLTKKYEESAGPLDNLLSEGEPDPKEHEILADIKKIETHTLPLINRVVELRKDGYDEQAHRVLMKDAKPAFTQWLKDINRFIDHEEAKNKAEGEIIREILTNSSNMGLISLLLAVIVAIAAAVWITFALKPLRKISFIMEQMSQGDYDVDVPNYKSKDELGLISRVTSVFKDNGLQMKAMQNQQEELQKRTEEEKKIAALKLADDFDAQVSDVIKSLSSSAHSLSSMAEQMNSASENTLSISNNVSAAAVQANANVQTVAASAEELTSSSKEINRQVASVASMASQAAKDAEITSISVNQLNELANNIGEVVGAIKDIAEQTNLLALNATIEAARAGEAGKGFAVVADEVKKLANETANKTGEIDERVTAIQEAIRSSVGAVEAIINNVKKIDDSTALVTSAVDQQNAATDEISRSVSEASTGTQEVSSSITEVERNASETKESSQKVLIASQEMGTLSGRLQEQVTKFLDTIRNS